MCMVRQCRHLNFDFEFIGALKTSRRICGRSAGARKKIHAPFTLEQNKEPDEGRRALWEAFEEDAYRRYPVFKPAILSGFQNAAVTPQRQSKESARITMIHLDPSKSRKP